MLQQQLVRYDAACKALAEAHAVDEVKDIRDMAVAISSYARQARNKELEIEASEIRFRAERRIGELMEQQRRTVGLNEGGRPLKTGSKTDPVFTLAEAGIDKHLADRARKYAAVPTKRFEQLMAERRDRIAQENARVTINLLLFDDDKAERRAIREAQLGAKLCATKRYGVIVGMIALDRHGAPSSTDVIATRDVASIAADDCVLGLWASVPMLVHALDVMETWGFAYKTHWVWAKDRIGPGHWNRNKHELFLFGTRGHVPCPAPGQQWDSLLEAPRRGGWEKPEIYREILEAYFPHIPKIELNRRGPPRHGWAAWGVAEEAEAVA